MVYSWILLCSVSSNHNTWIRNLQELRNLRRASCQPATDTRTNTNAWKLCKKLSVDLFIVCIRVRHPYSTCCYTFVPQQNWNIYKKHITAITPTFEKTHSNFLYNIFSFFFQVFLALNMNINAQYMNWSRERRSPIRTVDLSVCISGLCIYFFLLVLHTEK